MHSFSTPWKHQKTVWFSNFYRGVEKGGGLGTNGSGKGVGFKKRTEYIWWLRLLAPEATVHRYFSK